MLFLAFTLNFFQRSPINSDPPRSSCWINVTSPLTTAARFLLPGAALLFVRIFLHTPCCDTLSFCAHLKHTSTQWGINYQKWNWWIKGTHLKSEKANCHAEYCITLLSRQEGPEVPVHTRSCVTIILLNTCWYHVRKMFPRCFTFLLTMRHSLVSSICCSRCYCAVSECVRTALFDYLFLHWVLVTSLKSSLYRTLNHYQANKYFYTHGYWKYAVCVHRYRNIQG